MMLRHGKRRRLVGLPLVIGLTLLCGCGIFGPSDRALVREMRFGGSAEARREALLKLRGRVKPRMRLDLEWVLAYELDPSTRALAAQVLGELGDVRSVEPLRESVQRDVSWIVRQRALRAMGRLLGPRAGDDLEYVLGNEFRPEVRIEALEVARERLAAEAPDRLQELLLTGLADPSVAVKLKAHAILAEWTGRSAEPNPRSWREALQAG